MTMKRRTVAREIRFEGLGLHSGVPVEVILHPAEDGIHFRYGGARRRAIPENVTDTARCTRLGEISTIEHVMSALCGLEITDVEVEVTAPELPGLDGSAAGYVAGIESIDLDEVEVEPPFPRVFLQAGETKIAIGRGEGRWRYDLIYDDHWPGAQSYESGGVIADYAAEIAPARTLVLEEEVDQAWAAGLGRGLNQDSVLILGASGYVGHSRFPDEAARHKLLDLLGDLYLAGIPARLLNVAAVRSGHRTNVEAAARLAAAVRGA